MSEMLRRLLTLLAGVFCLPVDDPDPADPVDDPQDPDPQDPDPADPDEQRADDPSDPDDPDEPQRRKGESPAELRARVAAAEEDARQARQLSEDTARRSRGAPPPTEDEERHAEEERRLKDPKTTPLERWQIDSNRTLRENNRSSQAALRQAQDLSDRTNFDLKAAGNKRLAAVKDDVEKRLGEIRSRGQNTSREALAYYILGEKIANAKEPAPKQPKAPDPLRGRAPAARSDVRAKGPLTDRQKRERRLENVNI